ncbi:MAG: DUF4184 family protein [Terriglobales bacterium]
MPFTLAHPAAAVPFRRCGLVLSALVVGALAPDFEYFVRLAPQNRSGHQMPGVLLITFPAAFFVLWLFHACVKRGLAALLPVPAQQRLQPYLGRFSFGGGKRFALIAASIAVGIATHLLWDMFTHSGTLAYDHWMWLQTMIALPAVGARPVYKVLQYFSSVLGCLLLAVWIWRWWLQAPASDTPVRAEWSAGKRTAILAAMAALPVLCALVRADAAITLPGASVARLAGIAVVTAISTAAAEALVVGLSWELTHPRRTIAS